MDLSKTLDDLKSGKSSFIKMDAKRQVMEAGNLTYQNYR